MNTIQSFSIYNVIGELVINGKLNSQVNTIDLSSLAPNVYILNIENKSIRVIKKQNKSADQTYYIET